MKKILMILTVMLGTALYAGISSVGVPSEKEVKRVSVILERENTLVLDGEVNLQSMAKLQMEFLELHDKLPEGEPIYLIINTPGGEAYAGSRFIDTVRASKRLVHTITIQSFSMGYELVQELDDRLILGTGILMHHRSKIGGIGGQLDGELESQLDFLKRFVEYFNKRAAKRIGISLEEFKASLVNELWLFGEEAVRLNHADAIVDAICGESLTGILVETKEVTSPLGTATVQTTTSKCPLIQGELDVKVDIVPNPSLPQELNVPNPLLPQELNQKYKNERKLP